MPVANVCPAHVVMFAYLISTPGAIIVLAVTLCPGYAKYAEKSMVTLGRGYVAVELYISRLRIANLAGYLAFR